MYCLYVYVQLSYLNIQIIHVDKPFICHIFSHVGFPTREEERKTSVALNGGATTTLQKQIKGVSLLMYLPHSTISYCSSTQFQKQQCPTTIPMHHIRCKNKIHIHYAKCEDKTHSQHLYRSRPCGQKSRHLCVLSSQSFTILEFTTMSLAKQWQDT